MEFVDTHCHIHFDTYQLDSHAVLAAANQAGVSRLITVGTTLEDSQQATTFAAAHEGVWAAIGLHPHEARHYANDQNAVDILRSLAEETSVIAIGECGLDYYYEHSSKTDQAKVLEAQLQIAVDADLPVIFHVRDAFDDFFAMLDNFPGVRGVVHSFTAGKRVLDTVLDRGLYIGLNGIMTFTKDTAQQDMAKHVPLMSLVLETDAPFLTPVPFRGTICEPSHVVETAKFLAILRNESLAEVARVTTTNAKNLFDMA